MSENNNTNDPKSHQLDLEPNPFDQSFAQDSTEKKPHLDNQKNVLPPLASITQEQQQQSNQPQSSINPNALPTSLRSGPLSPAMLQGPSNNPQSQHQSNGNPFEASFAAKNHLNNEYSGLKTGLTPLPGGQYPPQSPNTASFFQMVNNQQAPALTPNTVNALNGVVASFDNSNQKQPWNSAESHPHDAFHNYRNYNQLSQDEKDALDVPQRYSGERGSGDAAANAANGLFLLSQASRHDASSQPPESNENPNQKRKPEEEQQSPQATKKRGRGRGRKPGVKKEEEEEDDDDAWIDDAPSPVTASSVSKGVGRNPAIPKSEMTEDEKRRNFLERNRQAALKCRQRKKAWLQQLQQKVEFLQTDNEALQQTVVALREEIGALRNLLSQHSSCNVSSAQQSNAMIAQIPMPPPQTAASQAASAPTATTGPASTSAGRAIY